MWGSSPPNIWMTSSDSTMVRCSTVFISLCPLHFSHTSVIDEESHLVQLIFVNCTIMPWANLKTSKNGSYYSLSLTSCQPRLPKVTCFLSGFGTAENCVLQLDVHSGLQRRGRASAPEWRSSHQLGEHSGGLGGVAGEWIMCDVWSMGVCVCACALCVCGMCHPVGLFSSSLSPLGWWADCSAPASLL